MSETYKCFCVIHSDPETIHTNFISIFYVNSIKTFKISELQELNKIDIPIDNIVKGIIIYWLIHVNSIKFLFL